jgi:2-methylcitrate dehydratase
MDATLKKITDFACALSYGDLPPQTIHECKRRLVDSLACALGAFNAEPSKIARTLARKVTSKTPARIFGTLERTSPELAAFANGVMIRYLDLNDATGSGGGHPSDALSALLAAGEANGADGRMLILAMVIHYELYLGFYAGVRVRNRGWDHVVYTVLGAAAAVARIMKLDQPQTANALSLALTPNMALDVVRRGELSMWKGCAGGNAARSAVFAAELAAEGMTAPQSVFEGDNGVWNAVGQFEWPAFGGEGRPFRVGDTQMKMHPCEYHAQSPIEAALSIRSQVDPKEIDAIVVRTYWFGWSEAGSEPEKWNPTTRETADHSIPYIVCAALLDGKIDSDSFAEERIADPYLRALMQKVQVIHDTELDKLHPQCNPCRLEIALTNGQKKSANIDYPKGHVKNAATDADIENKLVAFNNGLLGPRQIDRLLDLCWRMDELDDVGELISTLQI